MIISRLSNVLQFIAFRFLSNLLAYFEIYITHPLHLAVMKGDIESIQWLLDKGVNVNVQNKFKETALYYGVSFGQYEAVKLLLDNHADINHKNAEGNTALVVLLCRPRVTITDDIRLKMLELFIQRGIDVNEMDNSNITPIEYLLATQSFNEEITKSKALLLLLSTQNLKIDLNNQIVRNYFLEQENVTKIFSTEGYEKYKILAGYKLSNELLQNSNRFTANIPMNPIEMDTAKHIVEHVDETFLNSAFGILQNAHNYSKPRVISNNMYFLHRDYRLYKLLEGVQIKLQEAGINLEDLGPHFMFHSFLEPLSHAKEARTDIMQRVKAIFIKDLKLPELPKKELLLEELKTATTPKEKTLVMQKLRAPIMKEVFCNADIMSLVWSFLHEYDACQFVCTNKNPLETLIQFPDQSTLATIGNQEHDEASDG